MVVDPQVELVHSSELLQEAVHGSGEYKSTNTATTTVIKIKIRSVFEVAKLLKCPLVWIENVSFRFPFS